MSNRRFRLDVFSKIDEEMVDRVSERRVLFARNRLKNRRRILTVAIAAALCVCLIAGSITALLVTRKQVPVYLGMTVSTEAPAALSLFSPDELILSSQPMVAADGDGSLAVDGAEELYYAKPGQDIYITVHVSNPDNFEIQSFTLNEKTYSAYMFEKGSDMENLILKYNVGEAEGEIVEYTLDAIKYIDGERIKDVRLDGDRVVKVGVYTEDQPTAEMKDFEVGYNTISFKPVVTDKYSLISRYGGELFAAVYDGSVEVARKKLVGSDTAVSFEGLTPGKIYTIKTIALYDAFDGKGYGEKILKKAEISTKSHTEIVGVAVDEDNASITFDLVSTDGFEVAVQKTELLLGDRVAMSVGSDVRRLDGIMPGSYTLLVTYKYHSSQGESVGYSRCSAIDVSYICKTDAIVKDGEIIKEYSGNAQVYNKTTGDYRSHQGVDVAPRGEDKKVYAAFSGVVADVYVDNVGRYGNVVVIKSSDGRFTMHYASLENVTVKKGDSVAAKTPIATVGLAPIESAEKPHVHLELRVNGQAVNPISKFTIDQIVDSGEIIKECTDKHTQVYNKTTEDYRIHFAVDIAAMRADKNVYSAFSGTVTAVFFDDLEMIADGIYGDGGYGNVVEITSSDGLCIIRYASLDNVTVKEGDVVYEGDVIATVGLAPIEAKEQPHVHVELILNDTVVDPLEYIKK